MLQRAAHGRVHGMAWEQGGVRVLEHDLRASAKSERWAGGDFVSAETEAVGVGVDQAQQQSTERGLVAVGFANQAKDCSLADRSV